MNESKLFERDTKMTKQITKQVSKQISATMLPDPTCKAKKVEGQTIVIKIGGSALQCQDAAKQLMTDVADIIAQGAKVVLVHGGGPAITKMIEASGNECKFIQGLRVTDENVLAVATEVLDSLNATLTNELASQGVHALGMNCQSNNGILTARKKLISAASGAKIDIGLVGEVSSVDADALKDVMEVGVPIFVSLVKDATGQLYNVNADNVAMAIAVALGADKLVYLTDVPGIKLGKDVVMPELPVDEISLMIDSGIISGGMIPKVRNCAAGIRQGVKSIIITGSDAPGELVSAVVNPGSNGTVIVSKGTYDVEEPEVLEMSA